MKPNQGRESAYVTSRVKDLSQITNNPDYVALIACITPKADSSLELEENVTHIDANGNEISPESDPEGQYKLYLPQLVRDVDTLVNLFGDPRIDPETYRDLYVARNLLMNGFACYIAKVKSGLPYYAEIATGSSDGTKGSGLFIHDNTTPNALTYNTQMNDEPPLPNVWPTEFPNIYNKIKDFVMFEASSAITGENELTFNLIPIKPFSLNQVTLEIKFYNKATSTSTKTEVSSASVFLAPDTRNVDLLKTINAYLGGDLVLSLPPILDDSEYATVDDAISLIGDGYFCISNILLYTCGLYDFKTHKVDGYDKVVSNVLLLENMELHRDTYTGKIGLPSLSSTWTAYYLANKSSSDVYTFGGVLQNAATSTLDVSATDYSRSFNLYKDPRYGGTFISELSSQITAHPKTKPVSVWRQKDDKVYLDYSSPENYAYTWKHLPDMPPAGVTNPTQWFYDQFINPSYDGGMKGFGNDNAKNDKLKFADLSVTSLPKPTFKNEGSAGSFKFVLDPTGTFVPKDMFNFDGKLDLGHYESSGNYFDEYTKFEEFSGTVPTYTIPFFKPSVGVTTDFGEVEMPDPMTPNTYYNPDIDLIQVGTESDSLDDFTPIIVSGSAKNNYTESSELVELSHEDRRALHYIIKEVAAQRKDLTCIFSTPYKPIDSNNPYTQVGTAGPEVINYDPVFDLNRACDWVSARGDYSDLFEYGNSQALDYSEQAFYCEMYWSWVKWRVTKLVNGLAVGTSTLTIPSTPFVINNALTSYRARGSYYPVAGDQGGVLPESCVILQNPGTKAQRDKLISYRINPIYDTGLRGIQIYGNDTLNPQYTDLSAAHIARTLVQIRSQVDAYSEIIKFSLNDKFTWSSWINYVSTRILDPIQSGGGLQWYAVDMGENTTTREEISQRKIRGMVSLQFTQALEIIDLEFVVYASSLELG